MVAITRLLSKLLFWRRPERDALETAVNKLLGFVDTAKEEGPDSVHKLADAFISVGHASIKVRNPITAIRALESAIDLGRTDAETFFNVALSYVRIGQVQEAHYWFHKAIEKSTHHAEAHGYFLRNLHALDNVDLSHLKSESVRWNSLYASALSLPNGKVTNQNDIRGALRLGLLSSRFCRHAVGFLTLGAIERLNKDRLHVTLFVTKAQDDDYTRRFIAAADSVVDLENVPDADAAQHIADEGIDILIDLGGHSHGGRLLVMAHKPAPIQVKWAGGQHGTTGLDAIDYFLTDTTETPLDHDTHFVEKPVRLPNSYAVYSPPPDAPNVYSTAKRKNVPLSFGCFNNLERFD